MAVNVTPVSERSPVSRRRVLAWAAILVSITSWALLWEATVAGAEHVLDLASTALRAAMQATYEATAALVSHGVVAARSLFDVAEASMPALAFMVPLLTLIGAVVALSPRPIHPPSAWRTHDG